METVLVEKKPDKGQSLKPRANKDFEKMTNNRWTAENIPDQSGRVAIVTGANSGTGFEVAKELAGAGAHVIMGCRNLEKADDAKNKIQTAIPDASLQIIQLDLSDPTSLRSFASTYRNAHKTLDILCNNAGIMMVPKRIETVDGFELQLGTNHFGHFVLTGLLLDLIMAVDGRVVTMSSLAHAYGSIEFGNLQWDKGPYSTTGAYGRSKLANLLFTYELHRRLTQSGSSIKTLASHPGWSRTNLQSTGMNTGEKTIWSRISRFGIAILSPILAQSAHMGALPMLYAATSTDAQSGEYYGPNGRGEMRGYPKKVTSNERSHDESVAKELWEVSERLTGVSFPLGDKSKSS